MHANNIRFTAYQIYKSSLDANNPISSDDCWRMAEEKLSLFPTAIRNIPSSVYNITSSVCHNGSFGYEKRSSRSVAYQVYWEACRELFEYKFNNCIHNFENRHLINISGFYFFADYNNDISYQVASFIRAIEDKLQLDHLTTFLKTERVNCLWVEPSDFWLQQSMRLSVFTIFLRAGVLYDGCDYIKALTSQKYSNETMPAIMAFLGGRTKYTLYHDYFHRKNWHRVFSHSSESEINNWLIKP